MLFAPPGHHAPHSRILSFESAQSLLELSEQGAPSFLYFQRPTISYLLSSPFSIFPAFQRRCPVGRVACCCLLRGVFLARAANLKKWFFVVFRLDSKAAKMCTFSFLYFPRPRCIAAVCWFLLRGRVLRQDDARQKRFHGFQIGFTRCAKVCKFCTSRYLLQLFN